ncbi:unnamed protein product [Adineta steineri]|uniref:Uncharacterized protein n=1 Tax=Adineta steineri TaxID=433720 RepID=A0A819WX23_9BILA|nr:unnamed protein product [Adineta steineri]
MHSSESSLVYRSQICNDRLNEDHLRNFFLNIKQIDNDYTKSCSTLLHTARILFEMVLMKFDAYELANAVPILDPICFSLFFLFIVLICMRWETLHDVESFELSYEQLREKYSNPYEHFPDKIDNY